MVAHHAPKRLFQLEILPGLYDLLGSWGNTLLMLASQLCPGLPWAWQPHQAEHLIITTWL